MDGTSYSTLPSSSYLGLGSQGDLLHSANYGTYDTGIGSITSHPYQYQTTNFSTHLTDYPPQSSYSNDYLQSTHSNVGYTTQQPQHYPTDRYAHQSTYDQDPLLDDYTNSQTQRYNDTSVAPHKPTTDHQHQTSYPDTTHRHLPASNDNQHHQSQPPSQANHTRSEHDPSHHPLPKQQRPPGPESDHARSDHNPSHQAPPKQQRHPESDHIRSEHDPSHHPLSKQQRHPAPESDHIRSQHDLSHHPPPKQQRRPEPESNHPRSEHSKSDQPPKQTRHRSPSNGRNGYASETTTKSNTRPAKQPSHPVTHHHSPTNPGNGYTSETGTKGGNAPPETKTTKSTQMRAAAIKQKEETREQKQKSGNFPGSKKKPTPPKATKSQPKTTQHPRTDGEQSETENAKRDKKKSNSVPQQRKSRRDDHHNEDNDSSVDGENNSHQHTRSKSQKRIAHSDPHTRRHPPLLPPVRRGRGPGPGYYDPHYDYPFPSGHPLRGHYPYHDDNLGYGFHPYADPYDYRRRHLYEDAYDVPPYLAAYHDPYDGFFDYEKRKSKSKLRKHHDKKEYTTDHEDRGGFTGNETDREDVNKSRQSKKSKNPKHSPKDDENENDDYRREHRPAGGYYNAPYYDEGHMLELWRQERNDYLKKKFKPTIHDVLYSQQWMKSDSYLENQRRRALRDTQGYYFPYKKYTLKDYKDLQKVESQQNPYATINESTLDRKERARKRHDYGSLVERHAADASGGQQKTPRDVAPRKPWHINNSDPHDVEKLSKRDRALEYAKVQVVKHRPNKPSKHQSGVSDPTEQYVNSLFPQENDDGEGSVNGRNNQSDDDDDQ